MHRLLQRLFVLVLAAGAVGIAGAQTPPIKPGLWQLSIEQDAASKAAQIRDMQERISKLPPETRKKAEAMLKLHGNAGPGVGKVCMTKEQLAENNWQGGHDDDRCKSTSVVRDSKTWKFHRSCAAPNPTEDDGEAVFSNPEFFTVQAVSTSKGEDGTPHTSKVTAQYKWLGPDCGQLQPPSLTGRNR